MSRLLAALSVVSFVLAATGGVKASPALVLADGGVSKYRIVLGAQASSSERHAAAELQRFLREISGAELLIVGDDEPVTAHEVLVGRSAHFQALGVRFDWGKLGDEGFVLRTLGPHLVIAGGRLRGTMYGVYTFLEDVLGCRWYSSDASRIPRLDRVVVPALNRTEVPALEYREPFFTDAFDADWSARNRANGNSSRLTADQGGKITYIGFVHTFASLVPPGQYFATHPEYFSLVAGKRQPDKQLCLTNPEGLRIAIESVRAQLRANPGARIVSVSQNDTDGACECPNCAAIDRAEGSHAGTLLRFVNQVADAIAPEFPDVAVDTLAYTYTRQAPRHVKPRPNVIVRLCSIECCFSHALDDPNCARNRKFAADLRAWSKICNRLYVWDYVTDFGHYLLPFPNLRVLGSNVRFFVRNNVKGIFEQGSYAPGGHGEVAELRAYLLAKLLWNPQVDEKQVTEDFLRGYYGAAAEPVGRYLDLIHDSAAAHPDYHLGCFAPTNGPYLDAATLAKAESLLAEAARLADSPETRRRVAHVQLSVDYARVTSVTPYFAADKFDAFVTQATELGVMSVSEGRTLEAWAAEQRKEGEETVERLMAAGLSVEEARRLVRGTDEQAREAASARMGFIRDWQVVGPFEYDKQAPLRADYGPERGFAPADEFAGVKGGVRWRPASGAGLWSVLNLQRALSWWDEQGVGYAWCTVTSPKEQPAALRVGSNDGVAVYLGGRKVYENDVLRGLTVDEDVVPITLPQGTTSLLFKVSQAGGMWKLCARITDANGKPLPGVTYGTEPTK